MTGEPRTEKEPVDPTKNVLDLVAAAIERQDDLREALSHRLDTKIDGNAQLSEERHNFTRRELIAGEERRIEHKKDTKDTVDMAFAGAERAIAKSEVAAAEQIRSVAGTVNDLKDRVLTLETQQQTKTEGRSDSRSNIGTIAAVVSVILATLAIIVTIILANFMSTGAGT